jgi:hypothetical protein
MFRAVASDASVVSTIVRATISRLAGSRIKRKEAPSASGARDLEALAIREKRSTRGVQKIVSMAFLSPRIVQGAMDGTLPRGVSMTRLFDLPMDWSRQHCMLGVD